MTTPTLEEYLETIYKLSRQGIVRPSQIAESIGVAGPTVTATLKRLESRGFITRSGTDVVLTDEGMAGALAIVRRHRVAERFLVDVLGLDWDAAHEDACMLEHAMSDRVLVALEQFLENPDVCPHGHPIPGADGSYTEVAGIILSQASEGDSGVVLRVAEDDEALGYLGSLGLRPGAMVAVVEVAPFGGPLTIEVGGERRALSREVAALVTISGS